MNRQTLILIIILIVALLYSVIVYRPFFARFTPGKPTSVAVPVMSAPTAVKVSTTEAGQAVEFAVSAPTAEAKLVDPFALRVEVRTRAEEPTPTLPGERPKTPPAEPLLQGIWLDAGLRVAFISDQAVSQGDTVMGWKVISINKDRVILQKGSTEKILRLEGK